MATQTSGSHEEDLLLATSNPALLEAEAEAYTPDLNAPPPLRGKWKSLSYRRKVATRMMICVCIIAMPLVSAEPILRDLMYTVVCGSIGVAPDQCAQSNAANEAVARFYAWQTVLTSVLMLIMIPLVTGISERFGYKAGLMWAAAWLSTELFVAYGVVFMAPAHWTYWRMLLIDVIEAVSGGFVTVLNTVLLAFFQLFPEPELRPRYSSLAQGILGASATFTPSIGAFLARRYGMGRVLLTCATLTASSIVYALAMGDVPDFEFTNKPSQAGAKKSWYRHTVDYVRAQTKGLSVLSFNHVADRAARITAFVLLFNRVSTDEIMQGGSTALLVYTKQHFGWGNKEYGLVTALAIGSLTFWGLLGFPLLQRWLLRFYKVNPLGVDQLDFRFLLWSTVVRLLGFSGVVAARSSWQLIAALFLKAQSCLSGPTFMTTLVKLIPASEGASLITAATLVDMACGIFVPGLMMQLYKVTLSWWPRLIFELEVGISALQLLSILCFIKVVTDSPATV